MIVTVCLSKGAVAMGKKLGAYLGFLPLPGLYWPLLAPTVIAYGVLTQTVKAWLLRRPSAVAADGVAL